MSADPVVAARIGGLVAVAMMIGLGVASCQANEDRALHVRPVQAPPVTVWTPRPEVTHEVAPGTSVSRETSPATTTVPRETSTVRTIQPARPRVTGTRTAPPAARAAVRAASYANCAAVRAANADPIRRGQPGYGRHLDRDGDGVGCE